MKIGPVDIRNHAFAKRAMRGLDEAEVRAYLDLVADRLEESILEAEELRSRIDRVESRLSEYGALEKTLRDALVAGERVSEERLELAEREARIVLKNAEVEADKIVGSSRSEIGRLRAVIDDLRRQRITYVERFRALLRSQSKILEASLESYDPEATDIARVIGELDRNHTVEQEPARPAREANAISRPFGPVSHRSDSNRPDSNRPDSNRPDSPRSDSPRPDSADTSTLFPTPDGFHTSPTEPEPAPGYRDPVRREGDAPLSSYLGEAGLFSSAGPDEERRPEEG